VAAVLFVTSAAAKTAGSAPHDWPPAGEVTTGETGRTLNLPGSIRLGLSPGTRLRFVRSSRLALLPGTPGTPCDVLSLISGRVDVEVPHRVPLERSVVVLTTRGMGGVPSGGRMTVTARPDGSSVVNGAAQLVNAVGGRWNPLRPGFAREPIRPAPTVSLDRPVGFRIGGAPAVFRVSLRGREDTTAYAVEVWRAGPDEPSLVETLVTQNQHVELTGLEPGTYFVRAGAKYRDGSVSRLSDPQPVRVVGLSIPANARAVGNSIELEREQRVALDDPSGLETSFGGTSTFSPAPRELGPGLVRVRLRGHGDETELRLLLQDVRARVEISPGKTARPGKDLSIVVWLEDSRGRPLDGVGKCSVTVTVNGRPASFDWERSSESLMARLPWPRVPGLLRVEVRSATGSLVGRESFEIAPRRLRARMWRRRAVV
jgi:hypothetical protein